MNGFLWNFVESSVRFCRGGSSILQWRVSNPSERGTGGRAPNAPRAVKYGEGAVKFVHFLYRNHEFLCIPGHIYWHYSFQKGHRNQKVGRPDTLDTPESAPVLVAIRTLLCILNHIQYSLPFRDGSCTKSFVSARRQHRSWRVVETSDRFWFLLVKR